MLLVITHNNKNYYGTRCNYKSNKALFPCATQEATLNAKLILYLLIIFVHRTLCLTKQISDVVIISIEKAVLVYNIHQWIYPFVIKSVKY